MMSFRILGAYHLARWMGKVIFCFKIYLFRHQFHITPAETSHLLEFCLFASQIYVSEWISSMLWRICVQFHAMLQQMICCCSSRFYSMAQCLNKHPILQRKSCKSFMVSWAWACSTVSLFREGFHWNKAEDLWSDTAMWWGLEELQNQTARQPQSGKRRTTRVGSCLIHKCTSLSCCGCWITDHESSTLDSDKAESVVDSIKVVNDSAERTLALSSYNESITKNESDIQRLVQIVENNRKRIPDYKKTTLKQYQTR